MKVATQTTDAGVTTVGLFVDAGALYEDAKTNGASNLLTRLLLKGSAKRPEFWNEVANLGAELKFDVARDQIAIYGTCLSESVPKFVEIISDLVLNPKMSADDLEDVRKTVLRESFKSEPNLEDLALDYLHETAYHIGTTCCRFTQQCHITDRNRFTILFGYTFQGITHCIGCIGQHRARRSGQIGQSTFFKARQYVRW